MNRSINLKFSLFLWVLLIVISFIASKGSSFALFVIIWMQYPLSMNHLMAIKLNHVICQKVILVSNILYLAWLVIGLYLFTIQTNAVSGVFSIPSFSIYSLPFWISIMGIVLFIYKRSTNLR